MYASQARGRIMGAVRKVGPLEATGRKALLVVYSAVHRGVNKSRNNFLLICEKYGIDARYLQVLESDSNGNPLQGCNRVIAWEVVGTCDALAELTGLDVVTEWHYALSCSVPSAERMPVQSVHGPRPPKPSERELDRRAAVAYQARNDSGAATAKGQLSREERCDAIGITPNRSIGGSKAAPARQPVKRHVPAECERSNTFIKAVNFDLLPPIL